MKTLHYLNRPRPLARQVADFLCREKQSRPIDLSNTLVLTPTTGAARRIRRALAAQNVLSPRFTLPMQALLPDVSDLADRSEQEAAWAQVLQSADERLIQPLFRDHPPSKESELIKSGGVLRELCNLLAEGGRTPQGLEIPQPGFDDSRRWKALDQLYRNYLSLLSKWKRRDPNEMRLKQIMKPDPSIQHLVLACLPDLPHAVEQFAENLLKRGCQIDILIWQPKDTIENFDPWGRPDANTWADRKIHIPSGQIQLAAGSRDEAKLAIDFSLQSPEAGDYSIILADPGLNNAFVTELWTRKSPSFLPEGKRLIDTPAATIALEWNAFRKSRDLRTLRRLLELPALTECIAPENPLSHDEALLACDFLLAKTVASTLEQGRAAVSDPSGDGLNEKAIFMRSRARRLLAGAQAKLKLTGFELLCEASQTDLLNASDGTDQVLEIGNTLLQSPAFENWQEGFAIAFARTLRHQRLHQKPSAGAVELNGWLEAPWQEAGRMALCGLIEGCLPGSTDGHPFLPDQIRSNLGLLDNAARLARDAYLLECLIQARPTGEIRCSFSKFDAEGNPNRPSRLLLRNAPEELPERVLQLTGQAPALSRQPRRQTAWRWKLPVNELPGLTKISPTQFRDYLACPFRFCLKHVLKLDAFVPSSREMDAMAFGIVIHEALESFARTAIAAGKSSLQMPEDQIRDLVLSAFEATAKKQFGPVPPPAVQVQLANARTRLLAFAPLQAEIFAAGWQIIDAERKLSATDHNALSIGPLKLSGVIDRIDRNVETGAIRVMDYKTFSSVASPAEKHFGSIANNWLPEAEISLNLKDKMKDKAWTDLQLPLYRFILEHWYQNDLSGEKPVTAYFILPSDPYETTIREFSELDELCNPDAYSKAMQCANTIAEKVAAGIFWPPAKFHGNWDDPYAPLFVSGEPEACIDPETIEILKGTAQ